MVAGAAAAGAPLRCGAVSTLLLLLHLPQQVSEGMAVAVVVVVARARARVRMHAQARVRARVRAAAAAAAAARHAHQHVPLGPPSTAQALPARCACSRRGCVSCARHRISRAPQSVRRRSLGARRSWMNASGSTVNMDVSCAFGSSEHSVLCSIALWLSFSANNYENYHVSLQCTKSYSDPTFHR